MNWFVVNARDARWLEDETFGAFTRFEREGERFEQVGINLSFLRPGQPMALYHGEEDQEDFLVLAGTPLLLIEGEERQLRPWDFVHCPPWTQHIIVGAGEEPSVVLAIGGRQHKGLVYPVSALAQRYGAGVETEHRRSAPDDVGGNPYANFPAEREGTSPL